MPTDLPPDYKPQPAPGPDTPAQPSKPGEPPNPPGEDSPGAPGGKPPAGPDVVAPVPAGVPAPAGLPTF